MSQILFLVTNQIITRNIGRLLLLFAFGFASSCYGAEALTAQQIVNKASLAAYYGGDDGRTMARMLVVDANGRKQNRQFTILRKDVAEGDEQKFLLVFSRPADVQGTAFLVNKKPTQDDERWLYLPALDLIKRIAPGDKRTSFVGTHYFYEDVSGRSPAADEHAILEQDEAFYILKHSPKVTADVEFSYYKTWINKSNFLPVKIEYYDESNRAYRLIEAIEIELVQDIPTVVKAKVSNLRDGSYTLMQFREVKYDLGIPDDIFSERSLRKPPIEWLRK